MLTKRLRTGLTTKLAYDVFIKKKKIINTVCNTFIKLKIIIFPRALIILLSGKKNSHKI